MISPGYCRKMANYNAWQNRQVKAACEKLTEAALRADRGAYFGSIMKTLNHLLWGDLIWMRRFDNGEGPASGIADSADICPTLGLWGVERFRVDGRIQRWAGSISEADLLGELSWFSEAANRDVTVSKQIGVIQMFNHQTHHRGQIHAMLTNAGENPGDTDLFLMPEDIKWH